MDNQKVIETRYISEMYTNTIGTTILSYLIGMDEGTRPSAEVVNRKYLELKERCKDGDFMSTLKNPYEKGYVKSIINAAGLPWVKQDKKIKWVIFIHPISYNICFSRGMYEDDVLYILSIKEDGLFGLPQEVISACFDYDDFLKMSDDEIEKMLSIRREQLLKVQNEDTETKTTD